MKATSSHPRRSLARELCDAQCRNVLLPRLVPWLYVGLSGGCVYGLCWWTVWAFDQSSWLGWLHLLLSGPAAVVLVMLVRAVLEVSLAVLDIRAHADELGALPRRVTSWPAMRRIVSFGESRVWTVRRSDEP